MYLRYDKNLKTVGRLLRRNMTKAEKLLWARIKNKQIEVLQWYRQKPIAQFIVDFYCPKANLVIEIDGDEHYTKDGRAKDEERDEVLQNLNLRVLRFKNKDIFLNIDSVEKKIKGVVKKFPPLEKEGKGGFKKKL